MGGERQARDKVFAASIWMEIFTDFVWMYGWCGRKQLLSTLHLPMIISNTYVVHTSLGEFSIHSHCHTAFAMNCHNMYWCKCSITFLYPNGKCFLWPVYTSANCQTVQLALLLIITSLSPSGGMHQSVLGCYVATLGMCVYTNKGCVVQGVSFDLLDKTVQLCDTLTNCC